MDTEPLKLLFIGNDESFARRVNDLLTVAHNENTVTVVPTLDAGYSLLAGNTFQAILFDLPTANATALFQVTSLATRSSRMPLLVFGPEDNDAFPGEVINNGAQDYLEREHIEPLVLNHAIRCAIARQNERNALIEEKENYYGIFDHLVEGIFRTTTNGNYLMANVALARIYGYNSPVELMASIKDIAARLYVDSGRREQFVHLMQQNDTLSGFESKIFRKDGTVIWISENCRAVRNGQNEVVYYEGTVQDITQRKEAEEQIRRATADLSRSREELRTKNLLMEENLRTAREIQLALLPQQSPNFPHNLPPEQSAFRFFHRYQAAESVSGDFFSVSELSETEVGVFICDVTGHGVRAALVTAMIRALAEELKPCARDPGEFLRKLNFDLCAILRNTGSPMLTTAFYFVADWRTGLLRFANAGHPKPLLIRRSTNTIETLANACGRGQPALGLFEDPPYQTTEFQLIPGDLVTLFTDGLYEVQGMNEELYSQQRLVMDLQVLIHEEADGMFDKLLDAIRTFSLNHEFEDDVCLVGMEFHGLPNYKS